ncbi:MAG: hypothetical protein HY329_09950 [Chloroflexi bacterium]|nr:hypothetical protein [Chloroflexota bacterium]
MPHSRSRHHRDIESDGPPLYRLHLERQVTELTGTSLETTHLHPTPLPIGPTIV